MIICCMQLIIVIILLRHAEEFASFAVANMRIFQQELSHFVWCIFS